MHIKTLKLKNFRRFEDATFEFGPGFNLLVGENGSGKTSVLLGIMDTLGDFVNSFSSGHAWQSNYNVRIIEQFIQKTIRFEYLYPHSVISEYCYEATGIYEKIEFFDKKTIQAAGSTPVKLEGIGKFIEQIIAIESKNRTDDEKTHFTYPVVIFFQSVRLNDLTSDQFDLVAAATTKESRFGAYIGSTSSQLRLPQTQNWIIGKILERLQSDVHQKDADLRDELQIVRNAITDCVENCKTLNFRLKERVLFVEWKDRPRSPFDTLSDGQRGLIAMVADIARRACLLNPHLGENVLKETPGIVLIDELDLHLHPKWQRSIVKNLKKTFPKIQFIATTHSPQIIGECKTDEIDRVIRVTEQGGELVHNAYGKDSNAVLRSVMGAEDRDPEITKLLEELFNHIDEDEFDEARGTIEKLREAKAESIYEITEAEHLIARYERENKELSENNEAAE